MRNNCRIYGDPPGEPRHGLVWSLYRVRAYGPAGVPRRHETIVASAQVFEAAEAATADALRKQAMLAVGSDEPLQSAIRSILDD